ncbi:hypothetical protein HDU87_005167 [Geranomyces variabilis]|uniref:Uncharacterized protein n=1 Tax=Geranomyces variabilis TaxID=109894 RepID=A0AAD5TVF9_9FUNG|nr:hypothetical protein HDU87_005167 [Geranomyces variabilis]
MFSAAPSPPDDDWNRYTRLATAAEEQDGVLGITAGLYSANGAPSSDCDRGDAVLDGVDATCFPGFVFPAREGFALSAGDAAAGINTSGGGRLLRGACRGVEHAGRRVAELEDEVVAVRARQAQLLDDLRENEASLTSLAHHAADWQTRHHLPNPATSHRAQPNTTSGGFTIPTSPVLALFPSYRRLVHSHEILTASLAECDERAENLREMMPHAQSAFIRNVLEMEAAAVGEGGSILETRVIETRVLPKPLQGRSTAADGSREPNTDNAKRSRKSSISSQKAGAANEAAANSGDLDLQKDRPTVPLERVRAALDAMRTFRAQHPNVVRALRRGEHIEKNLRRLQRDVVLRMRARPHIELSKEGAVEDRGQPPSLAQLNAAAVARATKELERRIRERDKRAAMIVEKLRREWDSGERMVSLRPQPSAVTARRKKKTKTFKLVALDGKFTAPQGLEGSERPSLTKAPDEAVSESLTATDQTTHKRRAPLPLPQHKVAPPAFPILGSSLQPFTAAPPAVFSDYDHPSKPRTQVLNLTITNTSGMTNTVRLIGLDQTLKDRGFTVTWTGTDAGGAGIVPGRLSPGRAAGMQLTLNVDLAKNGEEINDKGPKSDIEGQIHFLAEVGGAFSVPVRATRGVVKLELLRDGSTLPLKAEACVIGGGTSVAALRIANRGIVGGKVSVSCDNEAFKAGDSGDHVKIPGHSVISIPVTFAPVTEGEHAGTVIVRDSSNDAVVGMIGIRGEALPVPLTVAPTTEIGILPVDPGPSGNASTVSVGAILRNSSMSCIHVQVLPIPAQPRVEITVTPSRVAVHRGSFRVNVRATAGSEPGEFAVPVRFRYQHSSGGGFGEFETKVTGVATSLALAVPAKGVAVAPCTVWDDAVEVTVPVENPGELDQEIECSVSHIGVLSLGSVSGGRAVEKIWRALEMDGTTGGSRCVIRMPALTCCSLPVTFRPRVWASPPPIELKSLGGGGGGGARGPHSQPGRRTTPYITLKTAHKTYRVPIRAHPTRPVLRFSPASLTTGGVAVGSARTVFATLVRCRTIAEEKRGGDPDMLTYTVGTADGVQGITVDAGEQSRGILSLGDTKLPLRVRVDESAFARRKEREIVVPVTVERVMPFGTRKSATISLLLRVPVVEPEIATTATSVSLGAVARGIAVLHTVQVSNCGKEPVVVSMRLISGDADAFYAEAPSSREGGGGAPRADIDKSGKPTAPIMAVPDDIVDLRIVFCPTRAGPASSVWEVSSACTQVLVTVEGRGVVPEVDWGVDDVVEDLAEEEPASKKKKEEDVPFPDVVAPNLIAFKDLALGDLAVKRIVVRNSGEEDVEVVVALDGAPNGPFTLNPSVLPTAVAPVEEPPHRPSSRSGSRPVSAPRAPAVTTHTLAIPGGGGTRAIPLSFFPSRENDHFSARLSIACPGWPTHCTRVVGRCWEASTAVVGYDIQPEGMRDGPWDIPPAVFIDREKAAAAADQGRASIVSHTEDEHDEDEQDDEDEEALYARVGPTVPPPSPVAAGGDETPRSPAQTLYQELDALRPVELETTHYGALHLRWARHPTLPGFVLHPQHPTLTLANLRVPPPREREPVEVGHAGVKIGAGGKTTMQTAAEKQAAKAAKRAAAGLGPKLPPSVPADFVVDSMDGFLEYYPTLGVWHVQQGHEHDGHPPGADEGDSGGLRLAVDLSEGTVEQGGERRLKICVQRPTPSDTSAAAGGQSDSKSAAAALDSSAASPAHPAAPLAKRGNSSRKRAAAEAAAKDSSASAAATGPVSRAASIVPPPPPVDPPVTDRAVRLEACFKVTLNGGLKFGPQVAPATENRVWVLQVVVDGVVGDEELAGNQDSPV